MKTEMQMLESVSEMSRKLGPYVLLELLLPGGTLFALSLFLYRHPSVLKRYAGAAKQRVSRAYAKTRRALARRASKARAVGADVFSAMRALG